jgi:hypothetical protein
MMDILLSRSIFYVYLIVIGVALTAALLAWQKCLWIPKRRYRPQQQDEHVAALPIHRDQEMTARGSEETGTPTSRAG